MMMYAVDEVASRVACRAGVSLLYQIRWCFAFCVLPRCFAFCMITRCSASSAIAKIVPDSDYG